MRRSWWLGFLWVLACAPAPVEMQDDLAYLEVAELQTRMAEGTLTSVELVSYLINRIVAIDQGGPALASIIELNPEALEIAQALDEERSKSGARGPLHGIPVLLKANIDTGDEMATTAGSRALAGHRAPDDAFHVAALRQAGVIILGKTNLSEWANFRSETSSSGWSSLGGQTRNPHVLDRNPCGSSSGSGVAVAAGLAPLAVGTETDGSIVCPASANGIVGIKPTLGWVSRDGIIPIAHTQDTAGPMARSVRDAALLLAAMAVQDPSDLAAGDHPGPVDFTIDLDSASLAGRRIGVRRGYWGEDSSPQVAAIYDTVVATLGRLGAEIVDPVDFEIPDAIYDAEYEVLLYEFKTDLEQYLTAARVDPAVDTLAELIEFNRANSELVMPWFGQEIFEKAQSKGPLTDTAYLEALATSHDQMIAILEVVFRDQQLDAFVVPTDGPAWTTDWVNGDHFTLGSSSAAAISGYPSITLPMGQVHGLPVGLSLIGLPWSEKELIEMAHALEQELGARREPRFLPTIAAGSSVESN